MLKTCHGPEKFWEWQCCFCLQGIFHKNASLPHQFDLIANTTRQTVLIHCKMSIYKGKLIPDITLHGSLGILFLKYISITMITAFRTTKKIIVTNGKEIWLSCT